jgi:hypothetical protein
LICHAQSYLGEMAENLVQGFYQAFPKRQMQAPDAQIHSDR